MNASLAAIIAVVIVSLTSLVGVVSLSVNKDLLTKISSVLLSLAAGTLIGDVFIHIIPEMYESNPGNGLGLLIILGIVAFFFMEKVLHWHHCHHMDEEHDHKHHPIIAINNLVGDGLHNFIDGIVIGATFLVSMEIGIATTVAVILHEIPQELGDFGVLIHSGYSRKKALLLNLLSSLTAIVGTVLALTIGEALEQVELILLAVAAGGFVYIALVDLLPEIKHEVNLKKSLLELIVFVFGILIMFSLTFLE